MKNSTSYRTENRKINSDLVIYNPLRGYHLTVYSLYFFVPCNYKFAEGFVSGLRKLGNYRSASRPFPRDGQIVNSHTYVSNLAALETFHYVHRILCCLITKPQVTSPKAPLYFFGCFTSKTRFECCFNPFKLSDEWM